MTFYILNDNFFYSPNMNGFFFFVTAYLEGALLLREK